MTRGSGRTAQHQVNSALHPGPSVPGHSVQCDESRHTWIIDQTLVMCSLSEYRCLRLLLEHADRCVSFARLGALLQEAPLSEEGMHRQEKMRLAHIMSNLRTKIWALGLDIVSVMNTGYMLLSDTQETPSSPFS